MDELLSSLKHKLKTALVRAKARYVTRRAWSARHSKVFELHPEYRRPCRRETEEEHLRLWRQLLPSANANTLRVCFNISGKADPQIVPEEVFASEIEPALNRYDSCVFLEDKNSYGRWFRGRVFPETFLHNIGGEFYDGDYRPLDPAGVRKVLGQIEYPVVIKPSMSSGGRDVCFPENGESLAAAMAHNQDFVVQERIRQHEFFRRFHDYGVNTLRVCTYKSVSTNEVHVLNAALRMGTGGSLDNLTQGGIVRYIHKDGTLNRFALDKYGGKFLRHPDSGLDFTIRETVPGFVEMQHVARKGAQDVYLARLVSFDMCLDEEGEWRIIEVNLVNQTPRFAQYAGDPFFGEFTPEVLDYCKANSRWRW